MIDIVNASGFKSLKNFIHSMKTISIFRFKNCQVLQQEIKYSTKAVIFERKKLFVVSLGIEKHSVAT